MKTVKTGQLFIALIVIKLPIFFDCLSSNMSSLAATLAPTFEYSVGVRSRIFHSSKQPTAQSSHTSGAIAPFEYVQYAHMVWRALGLGGDTIHFVMKL